ncbi:9400_t:CDS:10 [Diversispora eburnea]|uniref:9400_t:CDS:1 n=1 Tax=Diversispora eburnea TaxID=1213867 RepID=A0A9N8ZZA0_9GLOM|nr:9400_t:CDS:10 [Diversispora eburnea]
MFEESGFVTVTEPPKFVKIGKIGYNKPISALLYAVLTEDDYENYYDHIADHATDNYEYPINLMVQIVSYKGFKLYSKKIIERIIYLVKNLIIDHSNVTNIRNVLPALYDVVECLLRQIRCGDFGEKNIWLIKEILELLNSEILIRDHDRPGLESLRKKESIFCKKLFDDQYNTCFSIGRDLYRLLRNIPEFVTILHGLDYSAKTLILRNPTVEYCLSSRISSDLKARLVHYIENHTPSAYPRKFEVLFRDFFPVPGDCRLLMADIFRWIIGAFRSAKPESNNKRHNLIKGLFLEAYDKDFFGLSKSMVIESTKLALTLDCICFDRNNPIFRIISDLLPKRPALVGEIMEYLSITVTNFAPGFESEFRDNLKSATLAMVRKNILSTEELTQMRTIAGEGRAGKLMNDIYAFVLNNNNQPGLFGPQLTPQFNTNFSSRGPIFPSSITPQTETSHFPHSQRNPLLPPSPSPLVQPDNYNPPKSFSFPNQTIPTQQIPPQQIPQPSSHQISPQPNSQQSSPQPIPQSSSQRPSTPTFNQAQPPPSLSSQKQQITSPNVAFGSQRQSADQQQNLDSSTFSFPRKQSLFSNPKSQSTTTSTTPQSNPTRPNESLSSVSTTTTTTATSSQDQRSSTVKDNKIELAVETLGKIFKTFIGLNLFNKLVSWVFKWPIDESNNRDSNTHKAFELLRLITNQTDDPKEICIKARTKLMIYNLRDNKLDQMGCVDKSQPNFLEIYRKYLRFELEREDPKSDKQDKNDKINKFKDRFITDLEIYNLEIDLRQGKYNIMGEAERFDEIFYHLQSWESFDQLMLFHLMKAEWGGDKEKVEQLICSSKLMKTLDPLENPEIMTALLWILESIKPSSKIIKSLFSLITNAKSDDARSENIKFLSILFLSSYKNYSTQFSTQLDPILKEILKNEDYSEDGLNYAKAVINVIEELCENTNQDLTKGFTQIKRKVTDVKKLVEKATRRESSSEEQEDDKMDIEEDTTHYTTKTKPRVVDRKDRILRSQIKKNPPPNPPPKEATSEEDSEDELPKASTKQRSRKRIHVTSEEESDSRTEQQPQSTDTKKNKQIRSVSNVSLSRRQSISSNITSSSGELALDEESNNTNANMKSRPSSRTRAATSQSTSTNRNQSTSSSQQNIARRKNIAPAKKKSKFNSDDEE